MAPDGNLRPPYDKKYPFYSAWDEVAGFKKQEALIKGDGVSPYSKEYWDGYEKHTIPLDKAFHETIAEMTRIKFETGTLPGTKDWQRLYELVEKHWAQMTPLERKVAQPSGEKAWW